jgi:uncharacterized alkaline shock family protein YloU
MKIWGNLAIFFYTLACLALGFILIIIGFNTVPLSQLEGFITMLYTTPDVRLILSAVGIGIIALGLLIAQLVSGRMQREKTIAFENPDGQVTVSLSAIEDLIKRISQQIPEIKDLRPNVVATKKSVNIVNRVVLFAGASIPEVTERIQNVVKNNVQEMLGLEEPIVVKVHIAKISSHEKERQERTTGEQEQKPHVFKGIEYSTD